VPTVMYELPYLAITREKKGILAVRQGDIDGLANALILVLSDRVLRDSLGDEANKNIAQFEDRFIAQAWKELFAWLEGGKAFVSEPDIPEDLWRDIQYMVQEVNRSQSYLFNEQRWKIKFMNHVEMFFPSDKNGDHTLKRALQWVQINGYEPLLRLIRLFRR
jgi:hypothetical protein